ncbi:MAG: hypothetical protein ABIK28_11285 [Planctomycetota bacterium]
MTRKEIVCIMGIALLAGLLISGPFTMMGHAQTQGQTGLLGQGAFHAAGTGYGMVEGKGIVTLKGQAVEFAYIRNVSKTQVKIEGQCTIVPLPGEDSILVLGLKGQVHLKGKQVAMSFSGGPMIVNGAGSGKLWLKGQGELKIKDRPPLGWPPKLHQFGY